MTDTRDIVDLKQAADLIEQPWTPLVLAELNGQQVKLARLEGPFTWHAHAHEDELFLVLEGTLEMHFRDRVMTLRSGQLCVVPRGVEHKPVAMPSATVLLFEPATTVNTGDTTDDPRTIHPSELARL